MAISGRPGIENALPVELFMYALPHQQILCVAGGLTDTSKLDGHYKSTLFCRAAVARATSCSSFAVQLQAGLLSQASGGGGALQFSASALQSAGQGAPTGSGPGDWWPCSYMGPDSAN